jgi:hypothetical protein
MRRVQTLVTARSGATAGEKGHIRSPTGLAQNEFDGNVPKDLGRQPKESAHGGI